MDLDIKGPLNSVRQDFIELEQKVFPWSIPGANGPGNGGVTLQKRLRRVMPETEEEASLGYNPRTPVVTSVVNERAVNKWGTPQGYKIQVRRPCRQACVPARPALAHQPWHWSLAAAKSLGNSSSCLQPFPVADAGRTGCGAGLHQLHERVRRWLPPSSKPLVIEAATAAGGLLHQPAVPRDVAGQPAGPLVALPDRDDRAPRERVLLVLHLRSRAPRCGSNIRDRSLRHVPCLHIERVTR